MNQILTANAASSEFLQLLTVQLRNQDPIDPIKQENFVAQLTQFSMLEGVENLNTSFRNMLLLQEISQGVSLVGKEVSYQIPGQFDINSGRVEEMFVDQGKVMFVIQGRSFPIEYIASVRA
ncbi:MAG TPA: flagellar hook capping FlgD N-terminal domain-containing protein [Pirellulaceae bacterium]|nr:flagellar hook capping FlgD N-terminal domain-containing protein [Pirellulaceae bacterium]HMO91552.1 flagellar hook capping FlgD N-terminal domain-containing protein [Pirellulaceae bacterium]HMP68249.1 flagellar hook capping FlgD N-terminal domain-containing protein [Pirellulaceae bacterium]